MASIFSERRGGALLGGLGLALLLVSPVDAQETGSISGTVTAQDTGEPLGGAQVAVPPHDLSTVTGEGGEYTFADVPAGEVQVRARMLGYRAATQTVEVVAGETVELDFALETTPLALEEIHVTAVGEQRRRELGTSRATVRVESELEVASPTTVTSLMQGRASGMTIQQSSGTVGGTSVIRVRGASSISLDNTPLVIIDGAFVSNDMTSGPGVGGQNTSRLNDLNPHEIEDIEVIKGPSAASLYGARASGGVIRITTRRGREGPGEWTVRSEAGWTWDDTDWPDNHFNPRAFFGEDAPDTTYTMNLLEGVGAPDDPWREGFHQTYSAQVRGGTGGFNYFLSGELTDQEGALPNNFMERRNLRANFGFEPTDNMNISFQSGLTSSDAFLPDNDNNAFGYIGVALIGFPWEKPLTRDDPVTGDENVETCPIDFEVTRLFDLPLGTQGCADNPFFGGRTFDDVATRDNVQEIERITVSSTVEYTPFDFLEARGTIGYDQFSDQTGGFTPVDPDRPFDDASEGLRSITNIVNRQFTLDANARAFYDITPELRSTTTVGAQFVRDQTESAGSIGRNLPPGTNVVDAAARTEGFESVTEVRSLGFFVEQQFDWRDRLFVTPAIRFDDNSAFGAELGLEAYPRVMTSWVMSEEGWFEDLPASRHFDFFRLRAAWGESGEQPGSFAALQLLDPQRVTRQGDDVVGISLTRPGNPELKPERGQEFEGGFETELFEGRLNVDFTAFYQENRDAIVTREQAPSTGFPSPQFTNIGKIRNRGLELGFGVTPVQTRNVVWDVNLDGATVSNEITQLDEPIVFGFNSAQRHQEGLPFGAYYHPRVSIDADDEVQIADESSLLGSPIPEWEGSISSTLTLFGGTVTLHANAGFAGGHQLMDNTEEFMCGFLQPAGPDGIYGGTCAATNQRDADGNPTDEARIKGTAADAGVVGPFVYDADHIRLRTLSARFQLPERFMERFGATRGSVTLTGENLGLATSYPGLDPEISAGGGAQAFRAEFLTLPPSRRALAQLSITF